MPHQVAEVTGLSTIAALPLLNSNAWIMIAVAVLIAALWGFDYLSRAGTIARATMKEAVRQPVFLILLALAVLVIGANYYVPFFSLGEDTKMFIDCGLAIILFSTLLLSVWTASMSVADEIEGKTAMTLLSKPITRRQFVVGKYIGITQAALLMIIVTGVVFFALTYFKFGYDQREAGREQPAEFVWSTVAWLPANLVWPFPEPERLSVASKILPALALIFMEVAVMAALSVAISTRLPMLVNLVACFGIFVVGHLTPVLVASTLQRFPPVKFMAQFFATILPKLETFNMSAAVATGKEVPLSYLGVSTVYCAVYVAAAILLAFLMFEDRDLA
jgi:ABC-type transport system involved in multi-copper enzyme maturation permease subunit